MLKNNEPYRYLDADLARKKSANLEFLSKRSKVVSNLDTICRATGLPPVTTPDQLPEGERQMLKERELKEFVEGLYQPIRKQTKSRK